MKKGITISIHCLSLATSRWRCVKRPNPLHEKSFNTHSSAALFLSFTLSNPISHRSWEGTWFATSLTLLYHAMQSQMKIYPLYLNRLLGIVFRSSVRRALPTKFGFCRIAVHPRCLLCLPCICRKTNQFIFSCGKSQKEPPSRNSSFFFVVFQQRNLSAIFWVLESSILSRQNS